MTTYRSIEETQAAIRAGEIRCVDLTKAYLQQIQKQAALNIFIESFESSALQQAEKLDRKIQEGETLGKLFGIVISIKDNILYKGHPSTAGSKILSGFESIYSATAVERLVAEDAIIIGRTNCDEFGMGSSNENSFYGLAKNPHDPSKVPGGSSGGAAASVAAHCCLLALGSDTGGSVRQPAAFCGVYGFKPSYGRISRHGLIAYASSMDQIGIFANNTTDIQSVLMIISGPDAFDSTAIQKAMASEIPSLKETLEIAYLENGIREDLLSEEVFQSFHSSMQTLEEKGHTLRAFNFPLLDFVVPAYYILSTAEASSNLSRYDGVRYGHRSEHATDLESNYKKSRTEGFGLEVKRRIMLGTFVLSAGYYDAYFEKAQKARRLIVDAFDRIFEEVDFVILPVSTSTAWPIGQLDKDPVKMYLSDIFTVLANLIGHPAISIPVDSGNSSLPVGLQVIGKKGAEINILEFCKYIN